jgi:hypothetical protein
MHPQDIITLTGDYESRIAQLLQLARQQARLAQRGAGPRLEDALTELEDALSDHLGALDRAIEDDNADAEASGRADRERDAWHPLRAA